MITATPTTATTDRSDDLFAAAAFAARQPRGNKGWERIVAQLVAEAEAYLAFFDEVRS